MIIMDLDGTAICSKHRQLHLPDGSLDLAHWTENSTPEKIAQDTLLPLANFWKAAIAARQTVIVCTARQMQLADFNFLHSHGLHFYACLYRGEGDNRPDHELKISKLRAYARNLGESWAHFCNRATAYDDNSRVLLAYAMHNIRAIDARNLAA
jgi:hypothetical protein